MTESYEKKLQRLPVRPETGNVPYWPFASFAALQQSICYWSHGGRGGAGSPADARSPERRAQAPEQRQDRPVVALPAWYIERPHAVGAHVAEGHWGPRQGRHGGFRRKLPPSLTWFGVSAADLDHPNLSGDPWTRIFWDAARATPINLCVAIADSSLICARRDHKDAREFPTAF
jgi:hypothetical protein